MTDNGNNPVNMMAEGAKEAMRVNQQKRLKNILLGRKSLLTRDVKNVKEKLDIFETNFEDNDQHCENQIEDANDIVRVYTRATTRFQHLENGIEELKALIWDSSVAKMRFKKILTN